MVFINQVQASRFDKPKNRSSRWEKPNSDSRSRTSRNETKPVPSIARRKLQVENLLTTAAINRGISRCHAAIEVLSSALIRLFRWGCRRFRRRRGSRANQQQILSQCFIRVGFRIRFGKQLVD